MTFVVSKQTRVIDDVTVECTPMSVFAALDLLTDLAGVLEFKGANDVDAFVTALKGLGGGRLRTFLPRVLGGVSMKLMTAGGEQNVLLSSVENINAVLHGRLGMLPLLIKFAMEVNYKDFLGALVQLVPQAKEAQD